MIAITATDQRTAEAEASTAIARASRSSHAHVAKQTRRAIRKAVRDGLEPLGCVPLPPLADWAAELFHLSAEGSHTQGRWVAYPFQIALLDWMGDDAIEELDLMKSKRVGYTKMLLALMAYSAVRRRKLALWQPTDDDRDSFVKSEVDPMLRDVRALHPLIPLKAAQDTIKLKSFLGSVWHLLGGKAARAYRRITVALAILDELSGFDRQIEKSADAFTLARGRLEGAPFPKLVCGSTPRIKGLCNTEDRVAEAQALMRLHITCMHCGVEHPLTFGGPAGVAGLVCDGADPSTARHVCPHCRGAITQADYLARWAEWVWVDDRGRYRYGTDRTWRDGAGKACAAPRHVAARVWAAYSPQRSWADILREYFEAEHKRQAGNHGPMQGFVNETLGEVYELEAEAADEHELMKRREPYQLATVPVGCLALVAGVDVQDNRFEVAVKGFGRGEESWLVDYQVLNANPADERDWDKLDAYLQTRFRQLWPGGPGLTIECAGIDTGGHFTHHVYNFVRQREHRRIYGLRGSPRYGGPIKGPARRQDVNYRGGVIKLGVKLWEVGTDTAKDLIYGRLRVTQPGPGYMHFSEELGREYFEGLTAEGRVPQRTASGEQFRWVKRRARNEPLDCEVYATWAAQLLDLHRYTERMWARLEAAVQPPPDLFFAADSAGHARDEEGASAAAPVPGLTNNSRAVTRGVPRGW